MLETRIPMEIPKYQTKHCVSGEDLPRGKERRALDGKFREVNLKYVLEGDDTESYVDFFTNARW